MWREETERLNKGKNERMRAREKGSRKQKGSKTAEKKSVRRKRGKWHCQISIGRH